MQNKCQLSHFICFRLSVSFTGMPAPHSSKMLHFNLGRFLKIQVPSDRYGQVLQNIKEKALEIFLKVINILFKGPSCTVMEAWILFNTKNTTYEHSNVERFFGLLCSCWLLWDGVFVLMKCWKCSHQIQLWKNTSRYVIQCQARWDKQGWGFSTCCVPWAAVICPWLHRG